METAQKVLVQFWWNVCDRSMIPLSVTGKKYIPINCHFIILHGNKLKTVASTRNIPTNMTFGVNTPFGNVAMGKTVSEIEITRIEEVRSLWNTLEKMIGKNLRFNKEGNTSWYHVHAEGMRELSAAQITVVFYDVGKS